MRRLLALAAALIALTACGNGSAEPPPFTESASPSGTPTESESAEAAPTLPAEVVGTSPEAAKQTALLFVRQVNQAGTSGDTRLARELFSRDCENCESVISRIESIYAAGGKIQGETWSNAEVARPRRGPDRTMGVAVRVVVPSQTIQETSSSRAVRYEPDGRRIQSYTLAVENGRWQIVTLLNREA